MNSTGAINLKLLWGDKPCSHPDAIAERSIKDVDPEIWRCTRCGNLVDIDAWMREHQVDEH
jgi:hypothetical protein